LYEARALLHTFSRPTVCVTGRWAGVDNAWEQEKPEARKMLDVGGNESHLSSAPMKMGESHHFIRENGCLYKIWLQFADSPLKSAFFAHFRPPF